MASRNAAATGDASSSSIIALDKFILATRDSGYKGTASAISELVDNALQANASTVSINIKAEGTEPNQVLTVSILDDGTGMDPFTLRQALRFGGSSRFNDRAGLGRYGMGLPNSSLSQARRVTVYTWQGGGSALSTYLDVDEIASGAMTEVPAPHKAELPSGAPTSKSGTLVVWSQCDRLDNRRAGTIARKLAVALGQTFRFFIWGKTKILINGEPLAAIDPLFLRRDRGEPLARVFGEPMEYEVRASPDSDVTGKVRITFTELPIHEFHALPNDRKRDMGIVKGAGVSIVRAGREVDYGWFFMGAKRKENYDDWFRCQLEFDPVLDEAFGITHTKQQVHPQQYLIDILTPDVEQTAHLLHGRIRKVYATLQLEQRLAESEKIAQKAEPLLKPLPSRRSRAEIVNALKRRHPTLRQADALKGDATGVRVVPDSTAEFFEYAFVDGQLVLLINPNHTFFKKVYRPLAESDDIKDRALRGQLDLFLIAAARAQAAMSRKISPSKLAAYRREWSHTLATYLTA